MRSMIAAGAAAKRPPHIVFADPFADDLPLPPRGDRCACFLAPRRVFCISLVVFRAAMTRRFPSISVVIAAIAAAIVVAGAVTLVFTLRDGDSGGAPPLAGTVAHFSLSNPRLPAPGVAIGDLDGRDVPLEALRGRVVLVNFWATWCAPCLKEMPALDRLQASVGRDDLLVAAVSIDRGGRAVAEPWLQSHGIENLTLYLDPQSRAALGFRVSELPVSVLIDREGRVVGRMVGPAEWDAPEAEALVRHVVAEKKS
jgi:thiol-disulfide isomerase/thioredoxin